MAVAAFARPTSPEITVQSVASSGQQQQQLEAIATIPIRVSCQSSFSRHVLALTTSGSRGQAPGGGGWLEKQLPSSPLFKKSGLGKMVGKSSPCQKTFGAKCKLMS